MQWRITIDFFASYSKLPKYLIYLMTTVYYLRNVQFNYDFFFIPTGFLIFQHDWDYTCFFSHIFQSNVILLFVLLKLLPLYHPAFFIASKMRITLGLKDLIKKTPECNWLQITPGKGSVPIIAV